MSVIASQITSNSTIHLTNCSRQDQRIIKAPRYWSFVWRGIHRWPVNSPHKGPVTRKMFPFIGVIMLRAGGVLIVLAVTTLPTDGFVYISLQQKYGKYFTCLISSLSVQRGHHTKSWLQNAIFPFSAGEYIFVYQATFFFFKMNWTRRSRHSEA